MRTSHYLPNARDKLPQVVGTGLFALDVLLRDERTSSYSGLGGSAGNVLANLAFLGWSTVPVARLGRDVAGVRIRHEFETLNADTRFIKLEEHTCTPVVYQWPGDASTTHKFSFSCPFCGVKRGFSPSTDETFCDRVLHSVNESDVFYFDRVTPWALMLAEGYRKRGALVMFEPSVIDEDRESFQRAINVSNILKYAADRLDQLEGFERDKVDLEVQTQGAKGLKFLAPRTMTSWRELSALSVPLLSDTAGAGDWCSAGLLHVLCLAKNRGAFPTGALSKALRFGQALAALNCMYAGARGLTRSWTEGHVTSLMALLDLESFAEMPNTPEWAEVCKAALEAASNRLAQESGSSDTDSSFIKHSRLCCEPLII